MIRQPIISVLGHIDHGKTSLLDAIRGTLYIKKEAGGITQHIGATEIPKEIIIKISEKILKKFNFDLKIPGILFIDTPGHEAFLSLRERGSSISDLAILVIDITQGIQDQTVESLKLLINYKVPFVVALTKIDLLPEWRPQNTYYFLESIQKQNKLAINYLETKAYEIISQLSEFGFEGDLFYKVKDFRKEVALIPVSAKTKEGIAELLALVSGLSQKFLGNRLIVDTNKPARGTILEIRDEKGLGKVLDVIIYDGVLKEGDLIGYITKDSIKISKVRAIFKPEPLKDIRFKTKLIRVKEVYPASGVRLLLKDLDKDVLAGSPIVGIKDEKDKKELEDYLNKIREKIIFNLDKEGIIVKADTLGSLEGLLNLLKKENIPVKKAGIGDITREDIMESISILKNNYKYGVILGFNVKISKDLEELARKEGVKIFLGNVIYKLVEDYKEYIENLEKKELEILMEKLILPARIKILEGYVFRIHSPAIVGVEVLTGILKQGSELLRERDMKKVGYVKSIQIEHRSVNKLEKNQRGAISIENGYIGRNIKEGEILITDIPESHFKIIKEKLLDKLSEEEKEILRKIAKYHREKNPTWGL